MSAVLVDDIGWYTDSRAIKTGEPGIRHSYMASVATLLNHLNSRFNPVWLMGVSGFAFRIVMNETLCPSAISIFDWRNILPAVIEQAGYRCLHVNRVWGEEDRESEKREEAHAAIVQAIDRGVPSVVWDVYDTEWGLITSYDLRSRTYVTCTWEGKRSKLPFDRLGKNGVDILSVIIPQEPNNRSLNETIMGALKTAVAHADGEEWTERPKFQNGLEAYNQWALIFKRWAAIVRKGTADRIGVDICGFAKYHASHIYSARCYARDFMNSIAGDNPSLNMAASCYGTVAEHLEPVWKNSPKAKDTDPGILAELALSIREAHVAETDGVGYLRQYLAEHAAPDENPQQ